MPDDEEYFDFEIGEAMELPYDDEDEEETEDDADEYSCPRCGGIGYELDGSKQKCAYCQGYRYVSPEDYDAYYAWLIRGE